MTFTVERLSPELPFGRVLNGLEHQDLKSDAVREKLRHYWVHDGLVIFRGAEVTPAFQVELSEVFADLEVHPVREIRHPDNEKLIRLVSNPRGYDEDLIEVNGVTGCAWLPWHKDLVFTDRLTAAGGTILVDGTAYDLGDPNQRLMFVMSLAQAEHYRLTGKKRSRETMKMVQRRGITNRVPFGYERNRRPDGTLVAAIILGVAETVVLTLFGASWAPAISFAMLLGVLAVRPQGLFGRRS